MSSSQRHQVWEEGTSKPYVQPKCKLGEHPTEERATGKLRFVDIEGKRVFWLDPKKGPSSLEELHVKDTVGCTFDIEGDEDNIIVGAKYGVAYMNRKTGALDYLATPEQHWNMPGEDGKAEFMRSNDGIVDAQGRFWYGMINHSENEHYSDKGALFCYHPDGTLRRVIDGVQIPNGMGWSPDGKTFYFTDSPDKTIFKYDFDPKTGEISNKTPWFVLDSISLKGITSDTVPDGFCQDAEGCFWVALFDGGRVIRLRDADGKAELIGEVSFPTRCVTCARIIDKTLWVTTALVEDEEKYDAEEREYSGAVFAVPVNVAAKQLHAWRKP